VNSTTTPTDNNNNNNNNNSAAILPEDLQSPDPSEPRNAPVQCGTDLRPTQAIHTTLLSRDCTNRRSRADNKNPLSPSQSHRLCRYRCTLHSGTHSDPTLQAARVMPSNTTGLSKQTTTSRQDMHTSLASGKTITKVVAIYNYKDLRSSIKHSINLTLSASQPGSHSILF
jgi:hypothetical protein